MDFEKLVTETHAETVKNALRSSAGVFDGEECNACNYEGCTTELMLDAAHSIDHLLEVVHGLAEGAGK